MRQPINISHLIIPGGIIIEPGAFPDLRLLRHKNKTLKTQWKSPGYYNIFLHKSFTW
ncbi:hypothetical protein EMIT091MI3_10258 [Kosakonia quasisacchari]